MVNLIHFSGNESMIEALNNFGFCACSAVGGNCWMDTVHQGTIMIMNYKEKNYKVIVRSVQPSKQFPDDTTFKDLVVSPALTP